jgi:hypothetical protein
LFLVVQRYDNLPLNQALFLKSRFQNKKSALEAQELGFSRVVALVEQAAYPGLRAALAGKNKTDIDQANNVAYLNTVVA